MGQPNCSALQWESLIAIRWGDAALARQLRQECLDVALQFGDQAGLIWSYLEMGDIERIEGNYSEAQRLFEKAWQSYQGTSLALFTAFYHKCLGDLYLAIGKHDEAWQSFQESSALALKSYNSWCVAYAFNGMGRAALRLGETEQARSHFNQALSYLDVVPDRMLRLVLLEGIAEYFEALGDYERAVALSAYVIGHPSAWQEMKDLASGLVARSASRLLSTSWLLPRQPTRRMIRNR